MAQIRLKLPAEIELHAHRHTDGKVEFVYIERDPDHAALKRTATMLGDVVAGLGATLEAGEDQAILRGTIRRRDFGDMMVSEFLSWSSLADVTIGELLAAMVVKHAEVDARLSRPAAVVPTAAALEREAAAVELRIMLEEVLVLAPGPCGGSSSRQRRWDDVRSRARTLLEQQGRSERTLDRALEALQQVQAEGGGALHRRPSIIPPGAGDCEQPEPERSLGVVHFAVLPGIPLCHYHDRDFDVVLPDEGVVTCPRCRNALASRASSSEDAPSSIEVGKQEPSPDPSGRCEEKP